MRQVLLLPAAKQHLKHTAQMTCGVLLLQGSGPIFGSCSELIFRITCGSLTVLLLRLQLSGTAHRAPTAFNSLAVVTPLAVLLIAWGLTTEAAQLMLLPVHCGARMTTYA
jgi:hypothetical protein